MDNDEAASFDPGFATMRYGLDHDYVILWWGQG
jgi:hypothetical protein